MVNLHYYNIFYYFLKSLLLNFCDSYSHDRKMGVSNGYRYNIKEIYLKNSILEMCYSVCDNKNNILKRYLTLKNLSKFYSRLI